MGSEFRVGEWLVRPERNELEGAADLVHLEPRVMQVLLLLARRAGEVVRREEILKEVWDESFVTDEVLTNAIRELRRAFGDDPKSPRFIQTYPKKGYRLVAEIGESRHRRRRVIASAVALVVSILVAFSVLPTREEPEVEIRIIPLTSEDGFETQPTLSPDGGRVAFTWDRGIGGRAQLFIKMVDGGTPVELSTGGDAYTPAWSPDGNRIAFVRHVDGPDGELWDAVLTVDALGGSERRLTLLRSYQHGIDWTVDGNALVIVHRESFDAPDSIYLYSPDSGEKYRLSSPPESWGQGDGDAHPAVSPDGKLIAFVRRVNFQGEIFVQPIDGSEAIQVTDLGGFIPDVDWLPDGSGLVFPFSQQRTSWNLWTASLDGTPPRALSFGEEARAISVRGDRLAFARGNSPDFDIWCVGGPAGRAERKRLISSSRSEQEPRYSPDGARVAFVSMRSGQDQLWTCDAEGAECTQMTFLEGGGAYTPHWSPDGSKILFTKESASLDPDVFVLDTRGGVPQQLTQRRGLDAFPSWSRDGESIYFTSDRSGEVEIWKMPAFGGEAERITRHGGVGAKESSDGRWVYYSRTIRESPIWRVPVGGGPEELVLERSPHQSEWDLWQNHLVYIWNDPAEGFVIESLDLETRKTERLEVLEQITGQGLSVSTDGKWIAYTQQDPTNIDIMLADGFLAAIPR